MRPTLRALRIVSSIMTQIREYLVTNFDSYFMIIIIPKSTQHIHALLLGAVLRYAMYLRYV